MDKEAKEGGGPGDGDREDTGRAAGQEEEQSSEEVPGKPGTIGLRAVLPDGRYYRPTATNALC